MSLRLNAYKLSASRAGRLFRTTGPATEQALSPNMSFLSVEQCSQWWTGRGVETRPPDHCCTVATSKRDIISAAVNKTATVTIVNRKSHIVDLL